VAELTETAARLGAATPVAPPPGLRAAVLAHISRTRQVGSARPPVRVPDAAQRWRRRAVAAVAAALVAVAGVGVVWTVEQNRLGDTKNQVTALQNEQQRINEVFSAADLQLHAVSVAGGGRVTVAVSASHDDGVVVVSDMPAPPPGKVYQLWLLTGSKPTSVGVMAAGEISGTVLLTSLGGADHLGVTLEPAGGSATPTFPAVAGVAIT
jgi:anti-sigma-K factor RskA